MIKVNNGLFELHTNTTSYLFGMLPTGQPEHYYYGKKIRAKNTEALREKHAFIPGNTNCYDDTHKNFTLENVCLEMSSLGKGDIREPLVEIVHADGSITSDFVYDCYGISDSKPEYANLPGSYTEDGKTEHLTVVFKDSNYDLTLELHYTVYPECDVIARSSRIVNESKEPVTLKRLMSMQFDLQDSGYIVSSFHGAWAREMSRTETKVCAGKLVNSSYTGTSSNRCNPFFMVAKELTTEEQGDCFGFNLIYSGNHYESVEVSSFGKTRITSGMNPQSFSWRLEPGEIFESPEAVMTFSAQGYQTLSLNMHHFVREHIVRGTWKKKTRPVLLNSWEAAYFDINERKLLNLAKAGKEAGIELFVMDDGWFGNRNDDTQSLGDWTVNEKKLPGGVKGLCDKINALGLDFGIWVEPEMVNVNSHLYETHPDWCIAIPGKPHSEGRNQRILDLTRTEVQDYIIDEMTKVFSSANITYVKWDMNRTFTDVYSAALGPERQGEVFHRYVCGLYRCMKELTTRFPDILFEGCSAGGNRFDLGILCYFPQIWASDNTDAVCRMEIQEGYSYGYPQSVVSAHVSSCPNHQTLRITPLETRFHIASFGVCGYECNFSDMKKEDLAAITAQIELYKNWRETLQFGDFYRGKDEWTIVAENQSKAVAIKFQKLVKPNSPFADYHGKGLHPDYLYHFYNRRLKYNVKEFGDLVNTVAPIHIKQDSLTHNLVAKFVKMEGETEDLECYGDALMNAGIKLKQAFAATGYNEEVRFYQDFGSRMYFMEQIEE